MRIIPTAAIVVFLLALSACDSSVAPPTASPGAKLGLISLTGSSSEMRATVQANGAPHAECTAEIVATATGPAGSTIHWQDGKILWHFGLNRTAATDSTLLSAAEISKGWGANQIQPGAPQRSQWTFGAGAPFKVTLQIRYRENRSGDTDTVSYSFTCGPTPPPGGLPAPAVRNVHVGYFGSDSMLRVVTPGRPIRISYETETSGNLWDVGIQLTGAITARIRSRTMLFVGPGVRRETIEMNVPTDARVGDTIQIQAYATDAFLQAGVARTPAPLRVVSNVPPVIRAASFATSPPVPPSQTRLVGRFGAGDTLALYVLSSESRNPGWLVYTLGGGGVNTRDSVPVPFSGGILDAKIPVRAAWAGASSFSVQVLNNEGMYSETVISPADSFAIIPTRTPAVRSVTFASSAADVAHDRSRGLLYVTIPASGQVQVLSLATMTATLLSTGMSGAPAGVDLTPRGDTLLVAYPSEKAVVMVDLRRPEAAPLKVPILANGSPIRATHVRVAANGKVLVSGTIDGTSNQRTVEMTSSGSNQRERTDAAQANATFLVGRSPDHGRVVFESDDRKCTVVYDAETDRFGRCFTLGLQYGSWSSTPTGSRFASGYDVFDVEQGRLRTLPVALRGPLDHTTGLSPDGLYLYASAANALTKIRVSDGMYLERVALPMTVRGRILFASERTVIAVHMIFDAARVFVVDLP